MADRQAKGKAGDHSDRSEWDYTKCSKIEIEERIVEPATRVCLKCRAKRSRERKRHEQAAAITRAWEEHNSEAGSSSTSRPSLPKLDKKIQTRGAYVLDSDPKRHKSR